MKNNTATTKQKMPLSLVLILALAVTMVYSGKTVSGYAAKGTAQDSARAALFVFDVTDKQEQPWVIELDGVTKPGDSQTFDFQVTNSRNGKTSEVATDYMVTVTADGDIPAQVAVLENQTEKLTVDCTSSNTGSFAGTGFEASKPAGHNYTLRVEWPSVRNDMIYAQGRQVLALTVTVKGEQRD